MLEKTRMKLDHLCMVEEFALAKRRCNTVVEGIWLIEDKEEAKIEE